MKSVILGIVAVIVIVGGLIVADARWGQETRITVATPTTDYMTKDAWGCLLEIGVFDRNNFVAKTPPVNVPGTLFWDFEVTRYEPNDVQMLTIQYGYDGNRSSVVIDCVPPKAWMNWPLGVPSATPYLLPEEISNGGTPVS